MRSSFCTPAAAVLASGLLLLLAGCDLGSVGPEATDDAGFVVHHFDAATGQSSTSAPERVPACHYDAETDTFKLIHVDWCSRQPASSGCSAGGGCGERASARL